jgi:uncharacterized protein YbjT (DUF2867 family)
MEQTSSRPEAPVLVVGATGAVGQGLLPVLRAQGVRVRGSSRRPDAARSRHGGDWVEVDVDRPETLAPALHGCRAAVYLVHNMAEGGDYAARERDAASAFIKAAAQAGLERVVYLGGVRPSGTPSRHLLSRLETGRILRSGSVPCLELRAGMIIGPGSESWRIVRDLAMRLPIQLLPSWLQSRSQPLALADVCVALAEGLTLPLPQSRWLDVPGPELLTAAEILKRVGVLAGRPPVQVSLPLLTPGLSGAWLSLLTRANRSVARELVHGLAHDLVATDQGIWRHVAHTRQSLDEAISAALDAESATVRPAVRRLEDLVWHVATLGRP